MRTKKKEGIFKINVYFEILSIKYKLVTKARSKLEQEKKNIRIWCF